MNRSSRKSPLLSLRHGRVRVDRYQLLLYLGLLTQLTFYLQRLSVLFSANRLVGVIVASSCHQLLACLNRHLLLLLWLLLSSGFVAKVLQLLLLSRKCLCSGTV